MPAAPDAHSIALDTLGLSAAMRCSARALIAFACIEWMCRPSSGSAAISTLTWQDWWRSAVRRAHVFEWSRPPALAAASSTREYRRRHPIVDEIGSAPTPLAVLRSRVTIGSGQRFPSLSALPLVELVGSIDEFPDLAVSLGFADVPR